MKKTQNSGSDKKLSELETRTAKTNSRKLMGSVSDYRRTRVKVEGPRSYGCKDIWLTKS